MFEREREALAKLTPSLAAEFAAVEREAVDVAGEPGGQQEPRRHTRDESPAPSTPAAPRLTDHTWTEAEIAELHAKGEALHQDMNPRLTDADDSPSSGGLSGKVRVADAIRLTDAERRPGHTPLRLRKGEGVGDLIARQRRVADAEREVIAAAESETDAERANDGFGERADVVADARAARIAAIDRLRAERGSQAPVRELARPRPARRR
jgi:hypothetical protein